MKMFATAATDGAKIRSVLFAHVPKRTSTSERTRGGVLTNVASVWESSRRKQCRGSCVRAPW